MNLPSSIETEKHVIGAMLLSADAIDIAAEALVADDFATKANGSIFRAICELHESGISVDLVVLTDELTKRGLFEGVGGYLYLSGLASEVATARNIESHAAIVAEKSRLRRIVMLATGLEENACSQEHDSYRLIEGASDTLGQLATQGAIGGPKEVSAILSDVIARLEQVRLNPDILQGTPTGIPTLDQFTGGFHPGNLIILAARPSVGKTALSLQMMRSAALSGVTALVFSLEMSESEIVQRVIAQDTRVDLHRLRSGRIGEDEWAKIIYRATEISKLPIHIDDRAALTVQQVRAACKKFKPGLIVADYLQLMTGPVNAGSREQEVSHISRGLKSVAKEFNAPVLAMAQLSRALEARNDRRPRLSDLRESGSLEQDADVVMFLHKPAMYGMTTVEIDGQKMPSENMIELILCKQRQGPIGTMWLHWDAQSTTMHEVDSRHEDVVPF